MPRDSQGRAAYAHAQFIVESALTLFIITLLTRDGGVGILKMKHEIPFDFSEIVAVVNGTVDGKHSGPFLLDTGAQQSFFNERIVKELGLSVDKATNIIHFDSFQFGTLDFGPIDLRVRNFGHSRLYGLLGTRELIPYCVTFDLDRSVCVFDQDDHNDAASSEIEIFRGRPVVHIQYSETSLIFVLDTGSSANWLFKSGQEKLINAGSIIDYTEKAKSAWADVSIKSAKALQNVNIGGKDLSKVMFMQSDQFAWPDAPEDGIIGLGGITSSGQAIFDFPWGRFILVDGA